MAGQFRFKNNSGTVVAQISASNAGAMSFSGSALDFSSVTTLTLGTTTLSGTASFATTAVSSSYGLNALTGSNAMTASSADTLYVRNNATVLGSITAQTLIVQTVTSSVLFTTGSNKIGSSLSNVQELTGSVGITGSLSVNTNGLFVSSSGNVGIGTSSPTRLLDVSNTSGDSTIAITSADTTGQSSLFFAKTSDGNIGGVLYTHSDNAMVFRVNDAERMRITSGGNVGIGTTSPGSSINSSVSKVLSISNTSQYATLVIQGRNGGEAGITIADDLYIDIAGNATGTNNNIVFRTTSTNSSYGATERMRITSAGIVNLYSPTTGGDALNLYNSSGKLNIKMGGGGGGANQSSLSMYNSANTLTIGLNGAGDTDPSFITGYLAIGTTTNSGYRLYVNGTSAGTSAFQNVSDRRFKKDVTPIESALNIVKLLNGVSFNWNKDSRPDLTLDDKNHLGLIAQDVEEILPQVVSTGEDELQTKTISYSDIVPVLIEAIKELSAKVTLLENK